MGSLTPLDPALCRPHPLGDQGTPQVHRPVPLPFCASSSSEEEEEEEERGGKVEKVGEEGGFGMGRSRG